MGVTDNVALANGKTLQYQGRKASRAKSEQRRRLILEAALRIVISDGVRGIRHRAVAKEAGVPLAATTYYFKDIDELIVDTFTLYTEKALLVVNHFTDQFYQPFLQGVSSIDLRTREGAHRIVTSLAGQLRAYIANQTGAERDMLIVEQAFRYEAVLNPRIRQLAQMHRRALYNKAVEFLQLVNSESPEQDAIILLGMFQTLEYGTLLSDEPDYDIIEATLKRYLMLLVRDFISD
ncbi:TetR family transcriptional regulator [Bacterioplanes sanyensis]|uniref:TetR/AcrR family transcriptional regulator n=1 Tax=Bacterioplanes sanyensis TaxID=1249553 RepID=UPI00167785E7|nr:TetR family transcriptional regulator [Bacterioplanes sanyensis]GGY38414.1 TetR family transcriptional regulator [Bacterioplanes sanyensis]